MKTRMMALMMLAMCGLALLAGCGEGGGDPTAKLPGTPDGNMKAGIQGIIDGNPSIAFAAMPDSYQKDVNDLVHQFAGKMDAQTYDKLFAVIGKAGTVMRDQKSFIMNSKALKENPDVSAADLEANWGSLVGLFDVLANSEISKLENLKTLDVMKFLQGDGSKLLKNIQAYAALNKDENPFKEMEKIKAELIKSEGDSAMVKLISPEGEVEEVEFSKVEGKWVPTEMAEEWAQTMTEARKGIESMDAAKLKAQLMPLLAGLEANIDLLAQAKTQEEFEKTAETMGQQIMMAVFGAMMQMQPDESPMPPTPPMPVPNN